MKIPKRNYSKLISVLLAGFIIANMSGCSKESQIKPSTVKETYNQTYNQKDDKKSTTDHINESISVAADNNYLEEVTPSNNSQDYISQVNNDIVTPSEDITYTESDMKAIDAFTNFENDVDTILKSETSESIKDKAKGTFISIVDFVFYDGKINGVTFNELTDAGKEKVLSIANSIDTKIESKYPDYKETISDKTKKAFDKASELIKSGITNINEISKEKLGEDNYNAIIEAKDDLVYYTKKAATIIGDVGSKVYEKGKTFIKNWYEKLK